MHGTEDVLRQRYSYGTDPSQYAELFLPAERRYAGVAVVIHGGYWRSRYGAELGEPLAKDLAAHGIAAWNLEYRRSGNGGGWPQTFEDIAAGIDSLALASGEHGLDLSRVVALGHSAGGQLAVWAAGRDKLPPGTPGAPDTGYVRLTAVVSQAGLLDLREATMLNLSRGAVVNFLGESPETFPDRYRLADPRRQLPLQIPVYVLHSEADEDVPISQSRNYAAGSRSAAEEFPTAVPAQFVPVPGDHFALIDVSTQAYKASRALVEKSLIALAEA
jgi:acetyl esterase/lipase